MERQKKSRASRIRWDLEVKMNRNEYWKEK
jgi:hypothetical protein